MNTTDILEHCKEILSERGQGYENRRQRLMQDIVDTYSAATGTELSEFDGYTFMICLKLTRMQRDRFSKDHYIDLINYTALALESLAD